MNRVVLIAINAFFAGIWLASWSFTGSFTLLLAFVFNVSAAYAYCFIIGKDERNESNTSKQRVGQPAA